MRFADGSLAATPIALCEVQGYVYAALIARSHIATEAGDHDAARSRCARARRGAEAPVQRGLLGRDRRRRLLRDRARPRQAPDRRRRLQPWVTASGPASSTRRRRRSSRARCSSRRDVQRLGHPHAVGGRTAGTTRSRTTAAACGRTTTRSCAAGLMRYGFVDEAHRVMRGAGRRVAVGSATCCPSCSAACRATGSIFPVSYPTSCSPQAWAAASPLLFLRTLLRFEPDIRNSLLHLAPAVPDWIGTLRLERIPIMGGHLGVEVRARSCTCSSSPRASRSCPTRGSRPGAERPRSRGQSAGRTESRAVEVGVVDDDLDERTRIDFVDVQQLAREVPVSVKCLGLRGAAVHLGVTFDAPTDRELGVDLDPHPQIPVRG